MSKKIAIFLDRDGVINEDGDYVYKIDDFHFLKDSIEAMQMIKQKGYAIVIVTNQSGIARGLYSEEEFLSLTEWMDWSLMDRGVELDGVYYCPHHATAGVGKYKCECNCRKPKTGMYDDAAKECNIDLAKSYMVGDRLSDIQAGKNAKLYKSVLVKTGKELTDEAKELADDIYENLYEFAKSLPSLVTGDTVIRKKATITQKNEDDDIYMSPDEIESIFGISSIENTSKSISKNKNTNKTKINSESNKTKSSNRNKNNFGNEKKTIQKKDRFLTNTTKSNVVKASSKSKGEFNSAESKSNGKQLLSRKINSDKSSKTIWKSHEEKKSFSKDRARSNEHKKMHTFSLNKDSVNNGYAPIKKNKTKVLLDDDE